MVADALIYHPLVAHYLKYVGTTAGRDKLLRTLQYFSRFYAWYLLRTNGSPASIKPFEVMKKQLGFARKTMRLGKNVEHFKAAAVAYDSKTLDPVLKYLAVGRQLGYAGYLSFDMLTYLDASGIRPDPKMKEYGQTAYKSWFVGLSFSLLSDLYTLQKLREREAAISKKDGEAALESKKIQKERAAVNLQLIGDLCDICVPSASLGYLNLDDGIVGLLGTLSSLIGVYGVWKKTA